MHLVDGLPKKELARRLGLDVKTVRRALVRETVPLRRAGGPRASLLDPHRDRIERWLQEDPRITARRIETLLQVEGVVLGERSVREYVAGVRFRLFPRPAFVHRTHAPGDTMEGDFGDSFAEIAGVLRRVKFFVATLPASNAYFAKAYPVERLECLLDGIVEAFRFFRGIPRRIVLDNTALAVREVLAGPERIEQRAFHGFRGAFPVHADFCAPGKGWEKGSVEAGVGYVRDNFFRPLARASSFEAFNAAMRAGLEADLERRRLADGRTAREALLEEREHLRPLPEHMPETCRLLPRVADKFGHVRVEGVRYSVPIALAYRPVMAKLFHDRIEIAAEGAVVARHARSFEEGGQVLEPLHVLALLEKKHRAVPEATALRGWKLPAVFEELRESLRRSTRKPHQEWIRVLRLLEVHPLEQVEAAVKEAFERSSPRLETIRMLLRQEAQAPTVVEPAQVRHPALAALTVAAPALESYDALLEAGR
ncbi:MAG: IS21 family transposase [Thermoanaerobaculia bacterium]